jgi:hypothetical protein
MIVAEKSGDSEGPGPKIGSNADIVTRHRRRRGWMIVLDP